MTRLSAIASIVLFAVSPSAFADEGVTEPAETHYGPNTVELGVFGGGFISPYWHQFYDPDVEGPVHTVPARPELERVTPQVGARIAFYLHPNFGIELQPSVILAKTKMGDSAQIYGIGVGAILQKRGRVSPYLGLGIDPKLLSSDDTVLGNDSDVPIYGAAGARFWLSPTVALRVEGRYLRGPSYPHDGSWTLNASYGEFSVGVSFAPGGGGKAGPSEPPTEDPDPDKDGIIGTADACPNEAGAASPNGCPIKDTDGDGLMDADDKCVDQAETVNTWEDTDGCPDSVPDTDADGLNDLADKCKDQAEDKDGFQDDDGCPDPDNDGDGVADAADRCPTEKGVIDNNGCPDTDADGDGVVDRLDNCPTEKGTEKNRGCKTKQLVVLTKSQLKILDQVKFVTNSAKLSKASNKLLDNIARVLIAHPEIMKVKVEGHTDNVGKSEKNLTLSQNRAASVVAYLKKKGVDAERLEAIGHGDTKPIEDNATKKGRAQNRRVEFNIVNE